MNAPRIGVLAVQGAFREQIAMLEGLGVQALRIRSGKELGDAGIGGLILPGGESTTMMKLLQDFNLLEPLRDAITGGLPVLGTCAGMILLADRVFNGDAPQESVGGLDVTVLRNAFGSQRDSFTEKVDFPTLGVEALEVAYIRAPVVTETGPGVEVLARTHSGGIVAVRQGNLWGVSFHPEITGDDRLHRAFLDACGP